MHGFQNAYQGYNVPEPLVEQIRVELKKVGLADAQQQIRELRIL